VGGPLGIKQTAAGWQWFYCKASGDILKGLREWVAEALSFHADFDGAVACIP
jgi:hypothetical protein